MKETTKEQFTKMSETMLKSPWFSDRSRLEELITFSKVVPTDVALDVGCGLGFVVLAFAQKVARAVGVDLTEEMIRKARELQAQQQIQNAEFHVGDVERLSFPDEAFDLVTARAALHHFEHPLRALTEIKRVCKSKGRVVIEDALASDVHAKAELHNKIERIRDPSHLKMYSRAELTAFAHRLGLEVIASKVMLSVRIFDDWMDLVQATPEVRAKTRQLLLKSMQSDQADLNVRKEGNRLRFTYRQIMLLMKKP